MPHRYCDQAAPGFAAARVAKAHRGKVLGGLQPPLIKRKRIEGLNANAETKTPPGWKLPGAFATPGRSAYRSPDEEDQ